MREADAKSDTPGIGWVFQVTGATGSAQFRGRGVRPAVIGAFEWELPDDAGFAASAGVTYDSTNGGDRFVSGLLGAGVSKGLTDKLAIAAEVVAQQIASKQYGGNVVTADVSATYRLTNDVQIDALVGRRVTSEAPKLFFTVGISARF